MQKYGDAFQSPLLALNLNQAFFPKMALKRQIKFIEIHIPEGVDPRGVKGVHTSIPLELKT